MRTLMKGQQCKGGLSRGSIFKGDFGGNFVVMGTLMYYKVIKNGATLKQKRGFLRTHGVRNAQRPRCCYIRITFGLTLHAGLLERTLCRRAAVLKHLKAPCVGAFKASINVSAIYSLLLLPYLNKTLHHDYMIFLGLWFALYMREYWWAVYGQWWIHPVLNILKSPKDLA